jgi:signal transduction histidine kinase/FixJ family two-component response regulator
MKQGRVIHTKYTKVKIIAGYVLLLLLAVVAFVYLFGKISSFVKPSDSDRVAVYKLQLIGEISSELYHAETLVNTMSVRPVSFEEYDLRMDTAKTKIKILRTLDPDMNPKLDSLESLMDQKTEILKKLIPFTQQNYVSELYKRNFDQFLKQEKLELQDQLLQTQTYVKSDTMQFSKPAKRRGFFKRLSDLFSGQEDDTTVRITSSEVTIKDSTLIFYNPVDSLNKLIDNIHGEATKERRSFEFMLVRKIDELKQSEILLTNKLKETLMEIENKEVQNTLKSIEERRETLASSSYFVMVVLVVALLLAVVLAFMILKDISKSRQYRKALEEANAQTLELLDSREKLTMGITHDIKAPLSSIIGYIELLSNSKLNERQVYYLENMKGSSEHILHLVTDILEFNKLDAGKVSLSCIPFDERKLFEEVAASFRPVAEKKSLKVNFRYNSQLEGVLLYGDPLRIRQIVTNLLSNAVKFTEAGEVNLAVNVAKSADGATLAFSVADTGVGIRQKDFEKVFQEYVRVDGLKTDKIEGFGLGLSITKKLVDLHGGKISLASTYGRGSTFKVIVPLKIAEKKNVDDAARHTIKNALIVDDDKFHLTMLEEMLKKEGVEITACSSPFDALKFLENKQFDMVFTDIQMPDMNGFEFVKRLRNSHAKGAENLKVIALSARADVSADEFVEHGFTSFVNKPITSELLISTIEKYFYIPQKPEENKEIAKGMCKFDEMLLFASGDKEAESVILKSFVEESEKNAKLLASYMEDGNFEEAGKLAHKMLALFRLVGDDNIVAWLAEIEGGSLVDNDRSKFEQLESIIEEGRAELAKRQ